MNLHCQNLIGGRWQAGESTAPNTCPADTDQVLGSAPHDVPHAVAGQSADDQLPLGQRLG